MAYFESSNRVTLLRTKNWRIVILQLSICYFTVDFFPLLIKIPKIQIRNAAKITKKRVWIVICIINRKNPTLLCNVRITHFIIKIKIIYMCWQKVEKWRSKSCFCEEVSCHRSSSNFGIIFLVTQMYTQSLSHSGRWQMQYWTNVADLQLKAKQESPWKYITKMVP